MLIQSIVTEELNRNLSMQKQYEQETDKLPKGSLICKKHYYYLQYREGKKVITDYIGKDQQKINDINKKLEKRKHFESMILNLKNEQKIILKMLEVAR